MAELRVDLKCRDVGSHDGIASGGGHGRGSRFDRCLMGMWRVAQFIFGELPSIVLVRDGLAGSFSRGICMDKVVWHGSYAVEARR
jgi:hypothetical protein